MFHILVVEDDKETETEQSAVMLKIFSLDFSFFFF